MPPSCVRPAAALLCAATLLLTGCDSSPTAAPPVDDEVTGDVATYLRELPAWDEFAPPKAEQPPTPAGPSQSLPDTTLDVEVITADGETEVLPDMTYACEVTPYTMTDNPEQIVMYSPDRELLYPGALIQGKSHRDGLGSLLGLPIAERAAINVSIPSLANDDNVRSVEQPNQGSVDQAIGSMIGNATQSGLSTPSTISFQMEEYHSEQQFALSIKASGRYMNFEASASGEFSRNVSETTITAQFYQKMYEVVVEPPQTPDGFFSDDFTAEKLREQVELGRMGRDNLPVYVSNVVYGRMMMFSLTSTASEQEIRATLQAAYRNVNAEAEVELSAQQRSILRESKIAVASLGGNAEATLDVIRSGDWSAYFTDNAPLSSAAPLSYTFRNLGDGSIARVTETTEYNVRSCEARAANPGTFELLPEQALSLPIPTPVTTHEGDFNGDGRMDLVFNHRATNLNQFAVALASSDGAYAMAPPVTHPEQRLWDLYYLRVGDVNGDGADDLIWAHSSKQYDDILYTATSRSDGSFDFSSRMQTLEAPYVYDDDLRPLVGDITGDGLDDVVWHWSKGTVLAYYTLVNRGDGTFDMMNELGAYGIGGVSSCAWTLGNGNRDGRADLIGNCRIDDRNRVFRLLATGDGTMSGPAIYDHPVRGTWQQYTMQFGDINGDRLTDLIWTIAEHPADEQTHIYVAEGRAGGFRFYSPQIYDIEALDAGFGGLLADVNGDGRDDLVYNKREASSNRIMAALADANGIFSFSRIDQSYEVAADWDVYLPFVGDVNGSRRDDLLWVNPASTVRIFAGLARDM